MGGGILYLFVFRYVVVFDVTEKRLRITTGMGCTGLARRDTIATSKAEHSTPRILPKRVIQFPEHAPN